MKLTALIFAGTLLAAPAAYAQSGYVSGTSSPNGAYASGTYGDTNDSFVTADVGLSGRHQGGYGYSQGPWRGSDVSLYGQRNGGYYGGYNGGYQYNEDGSMVGNRNMSGPGNESAIHDNGTGGGDGR